MSSSQLPLIPTPLGKYAFMVYNVCAKMTIFNKLGFIKAGVEIVPIKQFAVKCPHRSILL